MTRKSNLVITFLEVHKVAKIQTMKLSLTLLIISTNGAPERKKQRNPAQSRTNLSSISCLAAPGDQQNPGGSPFTSVDNFGNGLVTFQSYENNADCYVDIGTSCGADGVEVEIVYMTLETRNVEECFDTINFAWLDTDGNQEFTEPQCGCLGDEDHLTCTDPDFGDDYFYPSSNLDDFVVHNTGRPTKYNLIGTDLKLVLVTDYSIHGGKIQVEWKCNTPPTVPITNTLEMAQAVLTGDFTVEMALDYGCSGRGLFEPFGHTIGTHVDETDAAFFRWKKCVQCASGNDKSNVLAYSYNVESDTCGKYRVLYPSTRT